VLDTKSPKYLEMAQGHISLSALLAVRKVASSRGTGSAVEEARHWRKWRCSFSHVVTGAPVT
jgi:hypothetical protein